MIRIANGAAWSLWGLMALGLVGCSGLTYNHDFNSQVSFADFQSYAWLEPTNEQARAARGVSPLVEKRIIDDVEAVLAAKGYRQATSEPPDFFVNFLVSTERRVDFTSYYTGWGYHGWYGGTQVQAREWTEGTLIIDVVSGKTKELAWRGWAQGSVDPNASPQARNRRIREAVEGTLKKFPPGS